MKIVSLNRKINFLLPNNLIYTKDREVQRKFKANNPGGKKGGTGLPNLGKENVENLGTARRI